MPKPVYQASDGTVFTDFEEANKYEVAQEMELFERLGLDEFLEQESAHSETLNDHPAHYHACRQFLSALLLWCSNNDKVLSITGKNDVVYRDAPQPQEGATSGAERGFPDISVPPGIRDTPVPYEPPPAEEGCMRR